MFGVYTLDEPADGVVRAPKLNCKKSRFGCTRCKLRRVKAPAPHAGQAAGAPDSRRRRIVAQRAKVTADLPSRAAEPDPPETRERRLLEAGLMRQYVARTGPAIAIDDLTRPLFADAVPERSLGCDALLYSMYSMAALHQGCQNGHGLSVAASLDVHRRYLAMALREHQASLQAISAQNVDDICMTSSLLRWLMICGTAIALYEKAWDVVQKRPDSLAYKLIRSPYALEYDVQENKRIPPTFDALLTREKGDADPWDPESLDAYRQASYLLGIVQCAMQEGEPDGHVCRLLVCFPMIVRRRLFDLVNERQPRALALLAYYFAFLHSYEHIWWIGPAPAQEVLAIADELSTHARWLPVLRWPLDKTKLSSDVTFNYEILRVLAVAPYQGSDVGEVLDAAAEIQPGDFESFYRAFSKAADRVHKIANAIDAHKHPVSARNARFREATYYRSADFFLHGNWSDPRINTLWAKHLAAFNKAIALLPVPGQRVTLQGDGFKIPAVFYGSGRKEPRPTLIMCNGYDGAQEELYHVMVEAALQRGMNVITFEGPGHPTVRREQNLGFIPEWEKVVTPVVDYAVSRKEVNPKAISLMGYSFGGYLAPRAAAFEHRIAAVLAIDGLYNFGEVILHQIGPQLTELWRQGNYTFVDETIKGLLNSPSTPTPARWGIGQGLWSFNVQSPSEWITKVQAYSLEGVVDKIRCPVFVGDAENESFFPGEAKKLADKLGRRATHHLFTAEDGAGEHCQVGASQLLNQVALDWLEDIGVCK
ncbi:2,6-dihydropseudooxynicotine hydrolase [Purpureocillium lavendulum]|uniref:2,6-dihydropseudooxynicotine hydrolase n=1 Tax=Purpureocillium lavendulum TaxID=1247861 RepID=A0AB34FTY2_9HYPO|nr:2,6-dihydropseudooxynicotine hydrolase [Purpureocillium lavendulum]